MPLSNEIPTAIPILSQVVNKMIQLPISNFDENNKNQDGVVETGSSFNSGYIPLRRQILTARIMFSRVADTMAYRPRITI